MAHRTFPRRILHAIARAHRVKQLLALLRRIALQLLLGPRLIDALEGRPRPLTEEVLRRARRPCQGQVEAVGKLLHHPAVDFLSHLGQHLARLRRIRQEQVEVAAARVEQ